MEKKRNNNQWFRHVLHPTDLSRAGDTAFSHALALAVVGRAHFTIMHVGDRADRNISWSDFPQVRETLARWNLLPAGSAPADVLKRLGMTVDKIEVPARNPVDAIDDYLDAHDVDLLVLATEGREGLPRWLKPSIAEPIARRSELTTLFVPQGVAGFIALDNAELSLNRILIPVDDHPDAARAIAVAARLAEILGDTIDVALVHVGTSPAISEKYGRYAEAPGWSLNLKTGRVVDALVETARQEDADLIVMPTAGHEDFLDILRGSTSEQVLRRAPCPVLAVPAIRV